MQTTDAEKLRKAWGDKPCNHPKLEKEYYLGTATDDYVCTQCGKADWGRNWNKNANRTQNKK